MNIVEHKDTERLAKIIAKNAKKNLVLALSGDLGAGKTTLTKYIAKELGCADDVTSPTFAILNIYEGNFKIYHMDTYRLSEDELGYLDLEEYFYAGGICIVEWPEKIVEFLPRDYLLINIDENRNFTVKSFGNTGDIKRDIIENFGD